MGFLDTILRRNSELESLFDLDFSNETSHRAYLKKMALEACINFIGRTISQSEFRFMKNGKRQVNDWDYLLNVRPNTDQTAATFWQKFVYELIFENEVLVILSDNNDLLIADSFTRKEYAVYPDIFTDVTVKDYTFKRAFKMDEVIYLTYNNEKLTQFMDGMFADFGDLFSWMIETNKHSNQIRSTVNLDATQSLDDESTAKLQKFIDKLFSAFRRSAIAIVPKLKGFDYNEVTSGGSNKSQSVEELIKLKKSLVDDVANILGIPKALVHGDLSDYETSIKAYAKFCSGSLVKKVSDELNAKLIGKDRYLNGEKIEIRGITDLNPLEVADAVDKLIASMAYSPNDIRVKLGDEPSPDPRLDKHYFTKNYQPVDSVEGGET